MPNYKGKLGERISVTIPVPEKQEEGLQERRKGPYPEDDERRRGQPECTIQIADIQTLYRSENRTNNGDVHIDDLILGRAVIGTNYRL